MQSWSQDREAEHGSGLAYPLAWPAGWERTPSYHRESGMFKGTLDAVRREVIEEINALVLGRQARTHTIRNRIVISSNMPLRKDGEISARGSAPYDVGVAVYFTRKKQHVCFACDKYDQVWKNLRAIQRTIEAMRGIERWGSAQLLDRAFTGFAALPSKSGPDAWETLGVARSANESDILAAYRHKAKSAHPDVEGGSHEAFTALTQAKDIALATLRG